MRKGLPELQFSHTKLGFTTDLRKPPHEETPPPPSHSKKKDNGKKASSCIHKNRLEWILLCKGQVPRATAWPGEGASGLHL